MPRVRRHSLPRKLWWHLLERVEERSISEEQLRLLANWLYTEPNVPEGKWFKRFPEMIVCGESELVKTFLNVTQTPVGEEVQ